MAVSSPGHPALPDRAREAQHVVPHRGFGATQHSLSFGLHEAQRSMYKHGPGGMDGQCIVAIIGSMEYIALRGFSTIGKVGEY